ncbi:hypothetical protein SAMN05720764_11480 [Fibrobacter sp. UWH5]|uniref:hypothetical protein n=1 Tax=Fibrobacter sp. UWH5 TaxID=1896211 RepID=UPI0009190CF1|nr:hypothetical protein [Fibrobacter sp. UWH5]SHL46412.1 hypothetical protein SAMN05720764_11480 [Fibrobacter sp. UWH5]
MGILEIRKELAAICANELYSGLTDVVVPEPYIPYIPENWNGVLVVAEAQNITEKSYSNYSKNQKIVRLYPNKDLSQNYEVSGPFPELDVKPWEDGTIPLALKAALDLNPWECAVGNACFWSRRCGNANENPNDEMKNQSKDLWLKMWPLLGEHITKVVCCGKIAWSIMDFVGDGKKLELKHSSRRILNPISDMLSEEDLFKFYPAVKKAYDELGFDKSNLSYKRNAVFYACHAVSWLKGFWI